LKIAYKLAKEKGTISERENKISFYLYPEKTESGKKFAGNKEVISGIEGKNWRDKRRKELDRFGNDFLIFLMEKENEKMKDLKNRFVKHYKMYYRINDFSLASVSNRSDNKNVIVKEMLSHFAKIK
jgi:hypothetical protein